MWPLSPSRQRGLGAGQGHQVSPGELEQGHPSQIPSRGVFSALRDCPQRAAIINPGGTREHNGGPWLGAAPHRKVRSWAQTVLQSPHHNGSFVPPAGCSCPLGPAALP